MAKSIRSKHRRRMRSVKREKFAKKDLQKLKATLMRDAINNPDAAESEMSDIVTGNTLLTLVVGFCLCVCVCVCVANIFYFLCFSFLLQSSFMLSFSLYILHHLYLIT